MRGALTDLPNQSNRPLGKCIY